MQHSLDQKTIIVTLKPNTTAIAASTTLVKKGNALTYGWSLKLNPFDEDFVFFQWATVLGNEGQWNSDEGVIVADTI